MKLNILLVASILFVCFQSSKAQSDFYANWDATNPLDKSSTLTSTEKVAKYLELLEKAESKNDSLRMFQLTGHLSTYYLREADFASAAFYINRAYELAKTKNNDSWKSWALHIKGIVAMRLHDYHVALEYYLQAVDLCELVKDTFCLALNLEQVGSTYSKLKIFDEAAVYYDRALPLFKNLGRPFDLALSLNNSGTFYSSIGYPSKSIPLFEQAIAIYDSLGSKKELGKAMNNLADAYRRLKRFEDAKLMYEECLNFNQQWNIPENLIANYSGLHAIADEQRDFESAIKYLSLYYVMHDSLIGAQTHEKIAQLELDYKNQQKDLELEKNKVALITAKQSLSRRTNTIILMISLIGFSILFWWRRNKMIQQKIADQQQHLTDTTKLLIDKNRQLNELKQQLIDANDKQEGVKETDDFEINVFDMRILTDEDWKLFQSNFERAHPGYIRKLRKIFPSMTEAEERLFLFIKLNLTKKEVASILGISNDSVKRTRNRLRKRIALEESQNLEKFIVSF